MAVEPSPKFQLNVYGATPLEPLAVKLMISSTIGLVGLNVKLVVGGDILQAVNGWICHPENE